MYTGVMTAATDSISYLPLTNAIYRFGPLMMSLKDVAKIHGHDERVSVESYRKAIVYYHQLILKADESKLNPKHVHSTEL